LYENNINVLDGKWLLNYLLIEVLEYITNLQKQNLENQEISITVNDLNEIAINNIYEIALKVKRLNIVTNDINKLKNIENKLYKEKGIMITVSNNKRKSLAKAKIIFNIDFPEEIINKYVINKNAILVNIENKIKVKSKSFNGINVNDFEIKIDDYIMTKFKENNMYENFEKNILYESLLYDKKRYQTIRGKIIKDKIKINCLIGNKGKIEEQEFVTIM